MLIGLVKDSVLRCFCHTCSVNTAIKGGGHLGKKPLAKKAKKPRCKQPKKKRRYHASTEIRSEEKSRGGMCYEVILAEPISDKPEPVVLRSPRNKAVTVEDINMKLFQAEERRKSFEAHRLASVGERLSRLQEASKKREESNSAFIVSWQTALEDKLELSSSNRDSYLNALKGKVAEHLCGVDSVRRQLESQSEELKSTIELKLKSAQENRDENLRQLMDKLKEHDSHAQQVRLGHEEAIRKLRERIQTKLDAAETHRVTELRKKLEVLREHTAKVNEAKDSVQKKEEQLMKMRNEELEAFEEKIKKNVMEKETKRQELSKNVASKIDKATEFRLKEEEALKKETLKKLEHKFEIADKNKNEILDKLKKSKEESDRRAKLVRTNKDLLFRNGTMETTSSG